MYKKVIKRVIDFTFAFTLLIVTSPLLILSVIAIKIESKGPILFKQKRIGKDQEEFLIYKFRSMMVETKQDGIELSDNERLTKTGNFLRKTSIDEIPQAINIIKGEMSFIGPRPLPIIYFPYYTQEELIRHNVRPGMSGLAQVNGRSNLQWEDRFKYDIDYVNNQSFKKDIKIFLKTIQKVFRRENIGLRGISNIEDFHTYREDKIEESSDL